MPNIQTDHEINIAISEILGWERVASTNIFLRPGESATEDELPDYCNDLNAMAKAESALTDDEFSRFGWLLLKSEPNIECRQYVSATARRRAEAFLAVFEPPNTPCTSGIRS